MSYLEKLDEIDAFQSRIQSYGPMSAELLKKVNYKFRLEWNYHSNSMEGNSLTKSETRSVMIGNITVNGKPIKDVLEMKGHDEVVLSILRLGAGKVQLSESRIREIHRGIMHEEDPEKAGYIGRWKTQDNYVLNYRGERYDYTPHADVPAAMHELMNWLSAEREKIARNDRDALHPVLLAIHFHLRFVSIHPFYDGNGRTARILTNLILIAYGYPPIWVREDERDMYSACLADIQAYGGNPDLLYEFMETLVLRSQQIVVDAIEGRSIDEQDDLDKKLALLKKRLGISHSAPVGMTYSGELVRDIINFSITPFCEAWELQLEKFDVFFQTRSVLVLSSHGAKSDRRPTAALLVLTAELLSPVLKSQDQLDFIKFQVNFANLLSVRKQMGVNGGEVTFNFFENRYEIVHVGEKLSPINKLYGEQLTESEIARIVDGVSNWVYQNLETILENEEGERL